MNLREYAKTQQGALTGEFGGITGMRNECRRIYREVFNYHMRGTPKTADDWEAAAERANQLASNSGNDPFMLDLLQAVFSEFERQYAVSNSTNIE